MLKSTVALQKIVGDVLTNESVVKHTLPHFKAIVEMLSNSYIFARQFNDSVNLRQALRKKKSYTQFEINCDLPGMLPQEIEGKRQYIRVMFTHYFTGTLGSYLGPMIQQVQEIVDDFNRWSQQLDLDTLEAKEKGTRLSKYVPLVVEIINFTSEFTVAQFLEEKEWIYPMAVSLIASNSNEIRLALCRLFRQPIAGAILSFK